MTLPAGWRRLELTDSALRAYRGTLGPSDDYLKGTVDWLVSNGYYRDISYLAVGYSGKRTVGLFQIMADLVQDPRTVDEVVAGDAEAGAQLGYADVESTRVALPAGDAARLSFTRIGSNGTEKVFVTGYSLPYVSGRHGGFHLSYQCWTSPPSDCSTQAESIVRGFAITP